jgi:hypothetical protein
MGEVVLPSIFFLPTPPKQSDSSTFILAKKLTLTDIITIILYANFLIQYCSWGTPSELIYYNIIIRDTLTKLQ